MNANMNVKKSSEKNTDKKSKDSQRIEVTLEALAVGGKAVGRYVENGITYSVFVPYGAPGDKVEVKILSKHKRYWDGEIIRILEHSSHRRKVSCAHFGICGGCNFLHITDADQRKAKLDMLVHIFKDIPGKIEPVVHGTPFSYRARGVFHGEVAKGKMSLGLHAAKSHNIVEIEHCPLMADPINEALKMFCQAVSSKELPEGKFRLEIIQDQLTLQCHYVLYLSQASEGVWRFLNLSNLTILSGRKILKQSEHEIHLLVPGETIAYQPPCFTQVNPEVNRKMILYVLDWAKLTGKEEVLDVFCGIGNFTFPLASKAKHVVGIENFLPSILTARAHAEKTKRTNVEFFCEDAMIRVKRLISEERKFHTIVLDPPREGIGKDVAYIAKLEPEQMFYISCNPRTLAQDIRVLMQKGYRLEKMVPLEMFPQTYHLEVLAKLVKTDRK